MRTIITPTMLFALVFALLPQMVGAQTGDKPESTDKQESRVSRVRRTPRVHVQPPVQNAVPAHPLWIPHPYQSRGTFSSDPGDLGLQVYKYNLDSYWLYTPYWRSYGYRPGGAPEWRTSVPVHTYWGGQVHGYPNYYYGNNPGPPAGPY